jgi:NitT/TauT family transport system substrate-binding protein
MPSSSRYHWSLAAMLGLSLACLGISPARADVSSINFVRQFGIAYLPFLIMEEDRLIEKHAAALGLPDFKVNWTVLSNGGATNDGLLSGQLSFGVGAVPAMLVLWDKTRNTPNAVRGVVGVAVMPTELNTKNPAIHTIKDFSSKDKIALPAVKVSNHALVLEMAAAQAIGPDNWNRLDTLTVAMLHPDAAAQIMSRAGEIDAHFTSPPFGLFELRAPGVHTVLNSFDVMGDSSLTVLWTTQRFAAANPHVVQAVFDAVTEAIATVNADKPAAADRYLRLSGDKISRADLLEVLADPHIQFTPIPKGVMAFARFMKTTGAIRTVPDAWTDLFLPAAQALPGN